MKAFVPFKKHVKKSQYQKFFSTFPKILLDLFLYFTRIIWLLGRSTFNLTIIASPLHIIPYNQTLKADYRRSKENRGEVVPERIE